MTVKLPVMIFTGFLGAGKTTLVNRLLSKPEFANSLVIVNEFGEVPLDHLLIGQSGETVIELANGCLCCSVRGTLIDTLLDIETSRYSRIIVETTGIADPLPIMQSLALHSGLNTRFHLHSLTSVFDCSSGGMLLKEHPEARRQIALADQVFLTRAEERPNGASSDAFAFQNYNTGAEVFSDKNFPAFAERLLAPCPAANLDISATPPTTDHLAAFETAVLRLDRPQSIRDIDGLIRHLANRFGNNLLRLKGVARHPDKDGKLLVLQMSAGVLHQPTEIEELNSARPGVQLVAISRKGTIQDIIEVFESFSGNVELDRPDRNAILENPLAIPGFKSGLT